MRRRRSQISRNQKTKQKQQTERRQKTVAEGSPKPNVGDAGASHSPEPVTPLVSSVIEKNCDALDEEFDTV